MEPVPAATSTPSTVPDLDSSTLLLTVTTGVTPMPTVGRSGTVVVVSRTQGPGRAVGVVRADAKLWSLDSPFLYDPDVVLRD